MPPARHRPDDRHLGRVRTHQVNPQRAPPDDPLPVGQIGRLGGQRLHQAGELCGVAVVPQSVQFHRDAAQTVGGVRADRPVERAVKGVDQPVPADHLVVR